MNKRLNISSSSSFFFSNVTHCIPLLFSRSIGKKGGGEGKKSKLRITGRWMEALGGLMALHMEKKRSSDVGPFWFGKSHTQRGFPTKLSSSFFSLSLSFLWLIYGHFGDVGVINHHYTLLLRIFFHYFLPNFICQWSDYVVLPTPVSAIFNL